MTYYLPSTNTKPQVKQWDVQRRSAQRRAGAGARSLLDLSFNNFCTCTWDESMKYTSLTLKKYLCCALLATTIVLVNPSVPVTLADESVSQPAVYLPYLAAPEDTLSPPPPVAGALFVESQWKTSSASVAVDAQGGQHVAFYYYEPQIEDRPTAAVYLYCAADCSDGSNWSGVSMAELVNEVQLRLTPFGEPRLLIRATSSVYSGGKDFIYAECNTSCTEPENWGLTIVASNYGTDLFDLSDDDLPQRSFQLDPRGSPRFLYLDRNYPIEPDHIGFFYVSCELDCLNSSNWTQALITEVIQEDFRFAWEVPKYPALQFTRGGQPRIVAELIPIEGETAIFYFACDDGCEDKNNWGRVQIAERGQGSDLSWDLALDSRDLPHVAIYPASLLDGTGERLYYLWCEIDCLNASNWERLDVGLASMDGQEPDLELDSQDRPRIAHADKSSGGLGYSWCNEACESPGNWQHLTVESGEQLYEAWPVAYPATCESGLWTSLTPTLQLDWLENPHVAYDATYHAYCLYEDPTRPEDPPYYRFHLVMRSVRVNSFPQP